MAKVRKKVPGKGAGAGVPGAQRSRLAPDRWLLGLAGAGVLLTAYLLFVHLSGGGALFCSEGAACDIVQESRWSNLFGLPITLWGLGLYVLIAIVAVTGRTAAMRWRRAATLSLLGVAVSLYLTVVGWVALEAFCGWCLASFALVTAIFAYCIARRPPQTPAAGWPRWLGTHAIVLLPMLALIGAAQAGWLSPPVDPRLEALAVHLKDSGAKYYGAFWCPNCQKQRRLFGRAADALPYVECSPNGRTGAIAFECASQGIDSYPTWVIRGQRHQGMLTPEELARLSRHNKWNAPVGQGDRKGAP